MIAKVPLSNTPGFHSSSAWELMIFTKLLDLSKFQTPDLQSMEEWGLEGKNPVPGLQIHIQGFLMWFYHLHTE